MLRSFVQTPQVYFAAESVFADYFLLPRRYRYFAL